MKRLPSLMIRFGITPVLALMTLMMFGGVNHLQAQTCTEEDNALLDTTDDDPAYFYGVGDGESRMRQLARSQSMAGARTALLNAYQTEVTNMVRTAMGSNGFDDPALFSSFGEASVQTSQGYINDSRVQISRTCREGTNWRVILVLTTEKGNILSDIVEDMEEVIEEQIESGDAEYSKQQSEDLFETLNEEIEKRRTGGQE